MAETDMRPVAVSEELVTAPTNSARPRRAARAAAVVTATFVLVAVAACSSGGGGSTAAPAPSSAASAGWPFPLPTGSPRTADIKGCQDLSGKWDLTSATGVASLTPAIGVDARQLPYTDPLGPDLLSLEENLNDTEADVLSDALAKYPGDVSTVMTDLGEVKQTCQVYGVPVVVTVATLSQ